MLPYDNSAHEDTLFTPHELIFSKLVRLPSAKTLSNVNNETYTKYYIERLRTKITETVAQARENLINAKTRSKHHYDRSLHSRAFSTQYYVFLMKKPRKNKLEPQYIGPHKIVKILPTNNVKISLDNNRIKIGHNIILETSTKAKIAVYFAKSNDNIPEFRYSYPKASIYTAKSLLSEIAKKKMCSALGLSIGWGALVHDSNIRTFLGLLTDDNNILPGITDLKNSDLSTFYLVTIPRVRPHKYLNLR